MSRIQLFIISAIFFVNCGFLWQQHRAGTSGPETPPLQGQGRWHYLAPLPQARGEVAVAEVGGKIYVLGGYADGFVDQPLNEEYDPAANTWRLCADAARAEPRRRHRPRRQNLSHRRLH